MHPAVALALSAAVAPLSSDGLGGYSRPVTARRDAQRLFDRGLAYLFAFNHDEAARAFDRAAALDPGCAMAHWGAALARGPHINNPAVPPDRAREAWAAVTRATERSVGCSPAERALVAAQAVRYADPPPADRRPLDAAYAAAMRDVWRRFPADPDAGALFAEAVMDLRPWDLWAADGTPRPETPEVVSALEAVLELAPNHPLALHLYVHAVEASPDPGRAAGAADRLRHLAPRLGHLVHMPSHIDLRRGRWQAAVEANERAIAADRAYLRAAPRPGFYRVYMAHNRHMLAFAALMQGQSAKASDSVRAMLAEVPEEWLSRPGNAGIVDGYFAMPVEVLVRFGRWDEVLREPEPTARFPVARALWRAARGVAYAAKKGPTAARAEQAAFRTAAAAVPAEAAFGNNPAAAVLAVAAELLEGEVLVAEGTLDAGLAALRRAVAAEDALRYDEPPDWVHPVRHALGATLMKAGRPADAERVYREDLARWPDNGWGLVGLARSLDAQGKAEAAGAWVRFRAAWARADVRLTSSCFCQPADR